MQTVSERFLTAIRSSHRVRVKVDAYLDGALIAADLPVTSGTISVDRGSGVRRQLSLSIPDAAILPTIGAALTPYGVELHVARGIDYGDGTSELVPLGVFRLDVGTNANAAPTTYTGPDLAKALIDAKFLGPTASGTGNDALAEITDLCHAVLSDVEVVNAGVTNPEDGTAALPVIPQVFWDKERWDAMEACAASLGAELAFDAAGRLVLAPAPSIVPDPVWTVDQGPQGVLIDFSRELSREDTFNGVVATGERSDGLYPARAVATDDDPTSPTVWGGPFGQVTYFYSSALIHTPNGAQQVADALLGAKRSLSRSVRLSCIPNPALDVGDVIAVRMPGGADEKHLIDRLTIPLDTASAMTIETRTPDPVINIVDPAPLLPPVDVGPVQPPIVLPPIPIPKPPTVPPLPPYSPPSIPEAPPGAGLPGPPFGPGTGTGEPTEYGEAFTIGDTSTGVGNWYVVYPEDPFHEHHASNGLSDGDSIPAALNDVWDPSHLGHTGTLFYSTAKVGAAAGTSGQWYPDQGTAVIHWVINGEAVDSTTQIYYDSDRGDYISFGTFPTDGTFSVRPLIYSGTTIKRANGATYSQVPYTPSPLARWIVRYDTYYGGDSTTYDSRGFVAGQHMSQVLDDVYDPDHRGYSGSLMYVSGARAEPLWPNEPPIYRGFRVHWNGIGDGGGGIGFNTYMGDVLSYGTWQKPSNPDDYSYVGTDIVIFAYDSVPETVIDTVPIDQSGEPTPSADQVFTLRHKPIRTLPEAVVRLHNVKVPTETYELDYNGGIFTVHTLAMGAVTDDVVTIVYYADDAPIIVDPLPDNPQPIPIPPGP